MDIIEQKYNRIRMKREEAGLSVIQLADLIGVNRATIYRWENNESTPPKSAFLALAHVFHTNSAWLEGISDFDESTDRTGSDLFIDKLYYDYEFVKKHLIEIGCSIEDEDLVHISINGVKFPPIKFEILVENYRKYGINADLELLTSTPEDPLSLLLSSDENQLLSDYRDLNDTGKETARNLVKGLKATFPKDSTSESVS